MEAENSILRGLVEAWRLLGEHRAVHGSAEAHKFTDGPDPIGDPWRERRDAFLDRFADIVIEAEPDPRG